MYITYSSVVLEARLKINGGQIFQTMLNINLASNMNELLSFFNLTDLDSCTTFTRDNEQLFSMNSDPKSFFPCPVDFKILFSRNEATADSGEKKGNDEKEEFSVFNVMEPLSLKIVNALENYSSLDLALSSSVTDILNIIHLTGRISTFSSGISTAAYKN